MKRGLVWNIGVLLWGFCTGFTSPVRAEQARSSPKTLPVVIDLAHRLQRFEGWGTSLCWWAKIAGGYPAADRERIADQLFDPVRGLGLTVVRYNIGGGENPSERPLPFRAAVAGYEPRPGVWDWSADANQRWMLAAAIRRGADQVEAFSNSPPWWMTLSGSVTGAADGGNNLRPGDYPAFADYLATVIDHFDRAWGIRFDTVEPLNEPAATWWRRGGAQEGCAFDRSAQSRILQLTAAALAARHLPTRLAASDENSIEEAITSFDRLQQPVRQAMTHLNTHSYNGSARARLGALARAAGQAVWMSEYGDDDPSGLSLSLHVLADMKQLQPAVWVIWQAADASGGWGLFHSNESDETDDWQMNEKFGVFGNYTRFLRPSCQMLDVADDCTLAGWNPRQQSLVIVTTNATGIARRLLFDVSRCNRIRGSAEVFRTSETESLTELSPIAYRAGMLHATAAPRSVTTFVLGSAAPVLPRENGSSPPPPPPPILAPSHG